MKKLVKVVSIVAALALTVGMLTGCNVHSSSSSENSLTRNGVTRTETTVTENGKTTTTVTYTDADGHQLSAEEGEAAMNGTTATAEPAAETAAENEEPQNVTASFSFSNLTGRAIKSLYITIEDHDNWGEDLLAAGGELPDETKRSWEDCFTYTVGRTWKMAVQFADADPDTATIFSDLHFDTATDPLDLNYTIQPNESGDGYTLTRE